MSKRKICKVRAWVNCNKKKNGDLPPHALNKEVVIINNLETAKWKYKEFKNEVKMYAGLRGYHSGYCQLFEPHIFDNGELAYWPDNDKYIDKFEF